MPSIDFYLEEFRYYRDYLEFIDSLEKDLTEDGRWLVLLL